MGKKYLKTHFEKKIIYINIYFQFKKFQTLIELSLAPEINFP